MKILIPTLGFGNAGGYRVLSELATHWAEEGHEVDFLVNEASGNPYFPTLGGIKWTTNFGRLVTEQERLERTSRTFNGWLNLLGLTRAISKIGDRYDVILANHSLTAWTVALATCGIAKKYYYIQAYEPEFYANARGLRARVVEWLSLRSYELKLTQICNAPNYIGYKNIQAKAWVPPGIDFDLFYPKTATKGVAHSNQIILGCIGRSEPVKGIRFVLEAFEALWQEDPRYQLHVAFGNLPEGWTHPGLRIVVPKSDSELADYYRSLDIMIAPGMVQLGAPHYPVMEAMACGVPVVTTGYLPANNSNSWIVEVGSSISIMSAIKNVLYGGDQNIRVAKALEDIAPYGWAAVSRKFGDIILGGST